MRYANINYYQLLLIALLLVSEVRVSFNHFSMLQTFLLSYFIVILVCFHFSFNFSS